MSLDELYKELDEYDEEQKKKDDISLYTPNKTDTETVVEVEPKIRTVRVKSFKVPDFNALLKFCEKNMEDDYEVEQFLKHTLPRALHKEKFGFARHGGGWSGAVKATINILRKMKEKGVL